MTMVNMLVVAIGLFVSGLNVICEVEGSSQICSSGSRSYFDNNGTITSANYPNDYYSDVNCSRTIYAATGHVLYIMFTDFDLESGNKCQYDYLKIYDGSNLQTIGNNYNGNFCGKREISSFISTGRMVRIEFHTDGSVARPGFSLSWLQMPSRRNCGTSSPHFNSTSGTLTSPHYPYYHANNVDCYWIITRFPGKVLVITFSKIDLETSSTCDFDYLKIYDGIEPAVHNRLHDGKLCGYIESTNISPLTLTSRSVLIQFHTDDLLSGIGFSLTWEQTSPGCSNISLKSRQQISCTNEYKIGSICTFSCLSGFSLVGFSSSTCIKAGNNLVWSSSQPQCRGNYCPIISIENGQSLCTKRLNVSSFCTHSCSSGYRLVGSANSTCTERSGSAPTWSTSIPRCQGFCPLRSISSGHMSCSNGSNVMSTCSYSCLSGYTLIGSTKSVCEEKRGLPPQWSTPIPRCLGVCPLMTVTHGSSICYNGRNFNSQCIFKCDAEYEIVGTKSSFCRSPLYNSSLIVPTWLPQIPTCRKLCTKPFLEFGRYSCSNRRSLGSICTFQCSNRYEVVGSHVTECKKINNLETGWNNPIPYCRALCPKINLVNGQTNCSKNQSVSSFCTFNCDSGYEVIGSNTATCTRISSHNSRWKPNVPTCRGTCTELSLASGTVSCTDGKRLNSICNFRCNKGFKLVGEKSSLCSSQSDENAKWTSSSPTCIALCSPIVFANGSSLCTNELSNNSVCIHQCNRDFHLIGSTSSRCLVSRYNQAQWIHADMPSCIGLPTPTYMNYTALSQNNKATFSCEFEGFPLPLLNWQFSNGSLLPSTSQFEIGKQLALSQFRVSRLLTVYGVDCISFAEMTYRCTASNIHSANPINSLPFKILINPTEVNNRIQPQLNVTTDECDGNALNISWNFVSGASSVSHQLFISGVPNVITPPSVGMIMLHNLQPETAYNLQVAPLFVGCQNSPLNNAVNVTTGRGNLTKPERVNLRLKDEKECLIKWNSLASAEKRNAIGSYWINVTEKIRTSLSKESSDKFTSRVIQMSNNSTQLVLNQLKPNTDYQIDIGSVPSNPCEDIFPVAWSSSVTGGCVTDTKAPTKIELSQILPRRTNNQIEVTLAPVNERNGPISCAFVVVQELVQNQSVVTEADINKLKQAGDHVLDGEPMVAYALSSRLNQETTISLEDKRIRCCDVTKMNSELECDVFNITNARRRRSTSTIVKAENRPLKPGSNYTYYVITSTPSGNRTYYAASDRSPPFVANVPETENGSFGRQIFHPDNIPIIVGCLVVVLLVLLLIGICYKKHTSVKREESDNSQHTQFIEMEVQSPYENAANPETHYEVPRACSSSNTEMTKFVISKDNFFFSYLCKRENKDEEFQKEFNKILPGLMKSEDMTTDIALIPSNRQRNKTDQVVPSDTHRVVLNIIDSNPRSDYINASLIDGFSTPTSYIAAQAPTRETINDFWRMIVEQRCSVIVMVTNLIEDSSVKCVRYWPEVGENEFYGNIIVSTKSQTTFGDYIQRNFVVTMKETKPVQVSHFQYLIWSENDIPTTTSSLLRLQKVTSNENKKMSEPILVHGSDGGGRTGVFIALSILTNQLHHIKSVNIIEVVHQLRMCRTGMISNLNQYIFLHKLIAELCCYEDTDVKSNYFLHYLNEIKKPSEDETTIMQTQFDQLDTVPSLHEKARSSKSSFQNERKSNESRKRKFSEDIPGIKKLSLVKLENSENNKKEVSNFNAFEVAAYESSYYFIATENPSPSNTYAFWKCVLEHNVKCVVMLADKSSSERLWKYWSEGSKEVVFDDIHVCTVVTETHFGYLERSIDVYQENDEETQKVQQFVIDSWPQGGVPYSMSALINVVSRAQNYKPVESDSDERKCVAMVHCSDGSSRSGTFCGIFNLLERLDAESSVDVFRTVKDLRECRPNMVGSIEQYDLCHQVVAEVIEESNLYQVLM